MTKIEYRVCRCILNDLYIYLVWNNSSMNLNHNDSCHFYKLMKCPYMRTKLRHINNIIFYKEEQNLTILFLKSCYAWISYKERSSLQMLLFLVMKCRNSWTRQQAKWKRGEMETFDSLKYMLFLLTYINCHYEKAQRE